MTSTMMMMMVVIGVMVFMFIKLSRLILKTVVGNVHFLWTDLILVSYVFINYLQEDGGLNLLHNN